MEMENERFTNPKLQRLYEALSDLFPTGWQDIGEEDAEMICLPVKLLKDNGSNHSQEITLWISQDSLEIIFDEEDFANFIQG